MATRTFTASKDSIITIRGIDGVSFGAGKDYHNYVGDSGDYTIRSLIQFNVDFSNVGSINSATLYLKTARTSDGTVNGVARGTHGTWNSGSIKFSRVTTTWTEGIYGTDEGFNGSNSVEWDNQPSTTATGAVNFTTRSSRPSSPAVDTIVITDIVKAWAPTSVTGGGNATNYGIQIRNNTEGGSDYCDWYSLEGGASGISGAVAPYIVIDYNAAAPTVTIGSPSTPASAGIAKLVNITDTTEWSASTQLARPKLGWNYSSAASLAQSSWRVRIYSASTGGTKYYDSGLITDTAHKADTYFEVPGTTNVPTWVSSATGYTGWSTITGLVNGTEYWWTIEVVDSSGNTSSESARYAFKVRWGQVIHVWDSGSTSSSQWDITYPAPPAGTQAAMFYRSTTTSTATTGTWYSSLGAVVSGRRYLQTMLRLSTDAGVQPTVGDITFSYLTGTVSPDNWEVDANGTLILNNSTYRFGTKSGLLSAASSAATIMQPKRDTTQYDVAVIANQPYIFSAYVKPTPQTLLTSRSIKLRVYAASGGSATPGAEIGIGSDNYSSYEQQDGWYRLFYKFTPTGSWVKPVIEFGTGTGAAAGDAIYVDGAQVEEGNVVRSWTPGFVTQAITIEGSGITVDKSGGGSLRLRGSTGGARDVIELGANGLNFGGSSVASLYSGAASTLNVTGDLSVSTAIRTATGGADPAVYIGDDSLIFDADISDTMGIQGQQTAANGGIVFGSGKDTNIYRSAANTLKTDDKFVATGDIASSGSIGFDGALYASSSLSGLSLDLAGTNGRQWQFGGADIKVSLSGTQPGCLIVKSLPGAPTTTVNGAGTQDVFADVVTNGGTALDNTNTRFYVYSAGGWKYAALTTPSDSRLKEEITEISGAIDTLRQLIPVAFKWKAPHLHERTDSVADNGTRLGFIADQVATTDLKHWVEAMNINGEEAEIATGSEEETTVLAVNIPQNEMEALLVRALLDIDTRLKEIEAKL